jgi:hypothetical protein
MEEKTKKSIDELLLLLSDEQKKNSILELNNDTDQNIIDFLIKTGGLTVSSPVDDPNTQTPKSVRHLWYKNTNNTWVINLSAINFSMKQ